LKKNRAWLYIPFNKLPLAERLQPIIFEFGVTRFPGNINMAAEDLEAAEFDWSFDKFLINWGHQLEKLLEGRDIHTQEISVA